MPRKKLQTLEELHAEQDYVKEELRKAKQREKILTHQISQLTRNARTHRLCTRGAMLEGFLPSPELLTDDEVLDVLKLVFRTEEGERIVKRMEAMIEARDPD